MSAIRNRFRAGKWAAKQERAAHGDPRSEPWESAIRASDPSTDRRVCNICGWHGADFDGTAHSEMAGCPSCGSIARDRFLFWCWTHRVSHDAGARVLETSPRLGSEYRDRMAAIVDYTASDYDQSAHRAMISLDLQAIDLPDACLDVVLTPHVLEHVPDTESALSELFRVLRPGGSILLMIPMPQSKTAPPVTPEYHGDNTLVFWRFGWDLREKLEAAGFVVTCLVPGPLIDRVRAGGAGLDSGYSDGSLDEVELLSACDPDSLTSIANGDESTRYGFVPDVHFICWHCEKPS